MGAAAQQLSVVDPGARCEGFGIANEPLHIGRTVSCEKKDEPVHSTALIGWRATAERGVGVAAGREAAWAKHSLACSRNHTGAVRGHTGVNTAQFIPILMAATERVGISIFVRWLRATQQ